VTVGRNDTDKRRGSNTASDMAIFTRRTLQRLIDENAKILSRKQIKKHVDELNRMHERRSLAFEWEVVLINAFSKVGKVQHEHSFGGSRKPDLYFESEEDPTKCFVADITTISDKGFEGSNSIEALREDLLRRVQEKGLRQNSFSLEVEGNYKEIHKGNYYMLPGDPNETLLYQGGAKTKLKLPGISRFEEKVFNSDFERFLDEIKSALEEKRTYRVNKIDEDIDLTIEYDPTQTFSSAGYLEYRRINHLTQNSVYQALEEKAGQLVDSKFSGALGIILCDGGYTPFHSMSHFSTHTVDDVIRFFLRHNPAISFVLTITVKRDSFPRRAPNEIMPKIYANPSFDMIKEEITHCIERVFSFIPDAQCDAFNAVNQLERKPQEGRDKGAMDVSEYRGNMTKVKVSARQLLEILAGRMTHEEFLRQYGFIATDELPQRDRNPFERSYSKGALITDISFERCESDDDDVITITLSGRDPAISPFVAP
jgi:hypothetical protein